MARSSSTVCTERRSVNGGWTETSSGPTSAGVSRRPRSWTVRIDCRWSWCIFQLPLTSGRGGRPPARLTRQAPLSGRGRSDAWRSASRPGRSPCSRSSREAPPPVDTNPTRPARPSWSRAADRVAPAHHAEAHAPGEALATVGCRPRSGRPRRRPSARSRTPSPPRPPRRRRSRRWPVRCRARAALGDVGVDDRSFPGAGLPSPIVPPGPRPRRVGSRIRSRRVDEYRPAVVEALASNSDAPTEWPWAARKVKAMPPPTISRSTCLEQ